MGEFAAVGAALSFGFASTLFTLSGRRYGPLLVMQGSVPVGLLCIALIHWFFIGYVIPINIGWETWFWLSISGATGFWLASICVMNAFIRIGPRLTLLIASINPILSAILAWFLLDQTLESKAFIGIFITISGIGFVVTEGDDTHPERTPEIFRAGMFYAIGGAVLQAGGFIFSTLGVSAVGDALPRTLYDLAPHYSVIAGQIPISPDPLSASFIRLTAGSIVLWAVAAIRGDILTNLRTLVNFPVALRQLMAAAITGTVMGASLVLVALQNAPVGIATTLINLTPIFLIPIGYVVFKERISPRAIVGTLIAIAGIGVIFL